MVAQTLANDHSETDIDKQSQEMLLVVELRGYYFAIYTWQGYQILH